MIFINPYRFGGFNPATLLPIAWYDASDTSTITASGGFVSQWNDKSGNAYHATQSIGTRQPATGTRTQNGLNVLDFDGTDDFLQTAASVSQIRAAKKLTQYMVFASDVTNRASMGVVSGRRSGASPMLDFNSGWSIERRTTNLSVGIGDGSNGLANSNYLARQAANSSTSAIVWSFEVEASSSTLTSTVNGTGQTLSTWLGTMSVANFLTSATTDHILNIGNRNTGTAECLNGFVCEVLLFDKMLTADEKTSLLTHLNAKWAL